jgi:hypothetical protein
MKIGYRIVRVENCTPPKAIEVINFQFSNEVYTVFWFDYKNCNRASSSVGTWHVKPKQLEN